MKKFLFNSLLIIVLLMAGGMFYWFQIRPSNIRATCQEEVKNKAQATEEEKSYDTSLANNWYRICLASKGMKPEDLLKE